MNYRIDKSHIVIYTINTVTVSDQNMEELKKMFSEKLKELRKKNGITQEKLAKMIEVSSGTVAMWETGKRKPNIITLKKLAHILGCTTDELLEPIEI